MRRTALVIAAAATLLLLATPSAAAPDRSFALSDAVRTASWDSALGVGTYVGSPDLFGLTQCAQRGGAVVTCDQTLIQLETPGDLTIDISTELPSDVYSHTVSLSRSDAAGTERADGVVRMERLESGSHRAARLARGYYLLTVSWDEGIGDYAGTAALLPHSS